MHRLSSLYRRLLVLVVLAAYVAVVNIQSIGGVSPSAAARGGQDGWHFSDPATSLMAWDEPEGYIVELKGQNTNCRLATLDEARALSDRGARSDLHIINPRPAGLRPQDAGLQITLMGTPQLDTFPQAKTAFVNAAANWQARIKTPISIVIDVDFGPTAFGKTFGTDTLSQTSEQIAGSSTLYPVLRQALIAGAANQDEASLYNSLSVGTLQTDNGTTSAVFGPATEFRATGILPATADPAGEMAQLGRPPAIAFNSNFPYTFDPSGGIAPDTFDFDALATHEMGHLLGFNSRVGVLEMNPSAALAVSQLDIFRTAPGATAANFGSRTRILNSGGMQDFYFGAPELAFSTGNGTSGDGHQAGNWKSVLITGTLIGIMDPSIPRGERRTISDNDMRAFEAIGYRSGVTADPPPVINSLSADLQDNNLMLSGTASDADGDITQADITLLDGNGAVVGDTNAFSHNFGSSSTSTFSLTTFLVQGLPTAVTAGLVLIDGKGRRSPVRTADFGQGDPNGPQITSGSFDGANDLLSVKGSGFDQPIQLESNGAIVSVRIKIKRGEALS